MWCLTGLRPFLRRHCTTLDRLARDGRAGPVHNAVTGATTELASGNARLREAFTGPLPAPGGLRVGPDEPIITNGAMEALNLCLQAVTQPGDVVAVETPTFYAALQALERLRCVRSSCRPIRSWAWTRTVWPR